MEVRGFDSVKNNLSDSDGKEGKNEMLSDSVNIKKNNSMISARSRYSAQSSITEKDFIGNEELSRKNIEELENKIDLFHRSIREIRTKRVPGAKMETSLTKNGFVLPIFSDEVVTKQIEIDDEDADHIEPPKHIEVSGDPVMVDMTDGRQFALWRRKEYKAPKRCPKTGKVID